VIELRSDNTAAVAPEILAAVGEANAGTALAYGGDDLTADLQDVVRTVFEHPTARVFPVTSGTAANSLALSAATPPWGAVLCHPTAHIITAEGGATSLFAGGAVMQGVDGEHGLIAPERLRAALESVRWGDPHESQPSVLSRATWASRSRAGSRRTSRGTRPRGPPDWSNAWSPVTGWCW
jgi:threonine aldolase